jgi:stage V sporulation protein G
MANRPCGKLQAESTQGDNTMEITDIKIKPTVNGGRMRAAVSLVFDGAFAVHDIKIIEGPDRLFLAMPSKRMADGAYRDIVHPITREMRELLENSILEVYHAEAAGSIERLEEMPEL